jgi:hypothetical protein
MIYSLRGAVVALVFVAGIGVYTAVDRGMNYDRAKATIVTIDRTCDFTETATDADGKTTSRSITDSCSSTDEFATIREKRNKRISGKAVFQVSYTAPQDGSYRTSTLKFTGRDDEFYELKSGDEIDVLVSKDDPTKIIKG